jgi:hypothetical protein
MALQDEQTPMQWAQPIEGPGEASLDRPAAIQPGLVTPIPGAVDVRADGPVETMDKIEAIPSCHSMCGPGETEDPHEAWPYWDRYPMKPDSRWHIRPKVSKQVYIMSRGGQGGGELGEISFRTPGGRVPLAD